MKVTLLGVAMLMLIEGPARALLLAVDLALSPMVRISEYCVAVRSDLAS